MSKGKSFSIRPERFDQADPEPRIFRDALGKSIPKAPVEIFIRDHSGKSGDIYFGKAATDGQGRLEVPNPAGSFSSFAYILSHPDYGTARVDRYLRETDLIVPLVSRLSEAYYRSIRGTVLDPDSNPVSGARIQCTNVRTLGEGLINSLNGWTYEALTDKQGKFCFYLPNEKREDERGYLIPPKSRYNVRIEAPRESGLLPRVDPIENDRFETVVLERGGSFRTFAFEDANGLITDPRKLLYIGVTIHRPDQSRLSIGYNDFKNGGVFPPGQYRAQMYGIADYEFEPLLVDEQSPDELIFRLPQSILYYGRMVHGMTGEPMAGAFVLTMNSKRKGNLSMIYSFRLRIQHLLQPITGL